MSAAWTVATLGATSLAILAGVSGSVPFAAPGAPPLRVKNHAAPPRTTSAATAAAPMMAGGIDFDFAFAALRGSGFGAAESLRSYSARSAGWVSVSRATFAIASPCGSGGVLSFFASSFSRS